jgi:hypothetical protein
MGLAIIYYLDIVPGNIACLAFRVRVLDQKPIVFGVKHQQHVVLVQRQFTR